MNAKISFLVPAYNAGLYIKECLDSMICQTCGDWEAVVVNDGSTDGTAAILSGYKDGRIRVITTSNGGVTAARKRALSEAEGDYVLFVDSDDRLSPDAAEKLLRAASSGADIVVFKARKFYSDGRTGKAVEDREYPDPKSYSDAIFTREAHGCLWNKMFRRNLFGPDVFFPEFGYGEDRLLAVQLVAKAREIVWIEDELYHYRRGAAGALSKRGRRGRKAGEARNHAEMYRHTGESRYIKRGARLALLYDWILLREILSGKFRPKG